MSTCFYDFINFNPRSREGSDYWQMPERQKPNRFQSTLPRRERLLANAGAAKAEQISIHAPAKGATFSGCEKKTVSVISIHAPAKGATQGKDLPGHAKVNFNPRSREGSDPEQMRMQPIYTDFNPRSREGSDA